MFVLYGPIGWGSQELKETKEIKGSRERKRLRGIIKGKKNRESEVEPSKNLPCFSKNYPPGKVIR
jgi:hypothetical protein